MAVDIIQIGTVYDKLEEKIKSTLNEQWDMARLTGSDYASVLSQTLVQAMDLAVKTVQNQPAIDKDIEVKDVQKDLYTRQTQGFDDNLKQKMLEIQLNAWSMMFSSGMLDASPQIITDDSATSTYNMLLETLNKLVIPEISIDAPLAGDTSTTGSITNYNVNYSYSIATSDATTATLTDGTISISGGVAGDTTTVTTTCTYNGNTSTGSQTVTWIA